MNQGFDSSANPNVFFFKISSQICQKTLIYCKFLAVQFITHTQNEHSRLIDKDRAS